LKNNDILKIFSNTNFVRKATEIVNNSNDDFGIKILYGSAKSLFVASLSKLINKKILLLVPNSEVYADFIDDFNVLLDNENKNVFQLHRNKKQKHANIKLENDTFLAELIAQISQFNNYYKKSKTSTVAVATPDIFDTKVPNQNVIKNHFCTLTKKQILDVQQFTTQLSLNGFQREQYVSRTGEFAVRGGIIDIFAPNMQNPIRIELWGDEIDSIRTFDTLSQRSKTELNEVDFIDSIFVSEDEKADTSIFDFLDEEVIFIIDSPDSIDFTRQELAPIKNFRKIFLNPLGNFSEI
jgi:transcription-repair coupling factor (superfamily II helicase)